MASKKKKRSSWKSPDDSPASFHIVQAVGQDALVKIVLEGGINYPSTSFRKNICTVTLLRFALSLLAPCILLDPRGGVLKQLDVQDALQAIYDLPNVRDFVAGQALRMQLGTTEALCKREAYGWRTMLAHMRKNAKLDYEIDGHPKELVELYRTLKPTECESQTIASPSRPNPFVHFRQPQEQSSSEDEEVATVIFTQFCPQSGICVRVYSDGDDEEASVYEAGPNGFAVAKFRDGKSYETEAPNTRVKEGRIEPVQTVTPAEVAKKREKVKRAAAKKAAKQHGAPTPPQKPLEQPPAKKMKRRRKRASKKTGRNKNERKSSEIAAEKADGKSNKRESAEIAAEKPGGKKKRRKPSEIAVVEKKSEESDNQTEMLVMMSALPEDAKPLESEFEVNGKSWAYTKSREDQSSTIQVHLKNGGAFYIRKPPRAVPQLGGRLITKNKINTGNRGLRQAWKPSILSAWRVAKVLAGWETVDTLQNEDIA